MLYIQRGQGVDGGLFEGIDGAGVFLGVGEATVSEDAGYGLDVGSVAQQVGAAAVAAAMESDRQCKGKRTGEDET